MIETSEHTPESYGAKFAELRGKLVETLGNDTVDLILQRSVREVESTYPGFRLVTPKDSPAQLSWDSTADGDDARSAYSALYAAMLVILARILGRQIAVRLAATLDADRVLQGQPLAHL